MESLLTIAGDICVIFGKLDLYRKCGFGAVVK